MSKTKSRFNDGLPEILSPMYDIVFKQIFATSEDLLKPFLKSVIGLSNDELEQAVVIDPHLYPEHADGKLGVMDIKVLLRSSKVIDVEMQQKKITHLRERILSYLSGMVREQIKSGDDYECIKRVITITITGHPLIEEDDVYHHRYTLYDPKTRSEFTDLIEVHILELPKVPEKDDGNELWWWMKYIMVERKEQLKMIAEKGPIMAKAATRLIEISEDEHTRHRLESYRRFEMDNRVMLKEAKAEGIEVGMEKGMERAAMAMKSEGMDISTISRITGLSVDDILRL
jgi:predicted transposase/invertase (TIGR01784 family)